MIVFIFIFVYRDIISIDLCWINVGIIVEKPRNNWNVVDDQVVVLLITERD